MQGEKTFYIHLADKFTGGKLMNIFSQFCGCNSCLWILILLFIAASCSGNGIDGVLAGSCTPILIAIIYTMWKNGTLSSILCGNQDCGCGCGCNH